MPFLPSLSVLTHTLSTASAIPRLVDIGLSLTPPADAASNGVYQLTRLVPSARVQTWRRDGAEFSMSPMGAIRVWQKQRLVASECVHDRQAHGAAPLNPEDYAYLEAFLLLEGRAWNDLHPVQAKGHDDA
ncbi:hydrogenase [Achromobacter kerstersii]|uniref:Uncharacterized protein n=1 Tax=Achromobacter kerstersii TaxID=1353890 RepID=A0A6S7ACC1_9BURK|nr:hydrogenase [Achromobacter kerstersii]CAB3712341.1 hypothetical protein LMG3441_03195 [Achromobacter kerstersii]